MELFTTGFELADSNLKDPQLTSIPHKEDACVCSFKYKEKSLIQR
jgi:hypothetical protein